MMSAVTHLTMDELQAGLSEIRESPKDVGVVRLIVRRPRSGEREVLEQGELSLADGLVGDSWKARGSSRMKDGAADPNCQVTVMNARAIALLAREKARWELAGDQLFIDLDLSASNLPPGTRLAVGSALIEVSTQPHTGCHKFQGRYGLDALNFVNSPEGRKLNLRGINAKVVQAGVIRVGDEARKFR
jgi:MOSC domain-containing protein YiiM